MVTNLHYIGIIQALLVGFILFWIKRDGKREFLFLALLLCCLGIAILNETYGDTIDRDFHFLYPFKFFFLLPNLVYLHVSAKMTEKLDRRLVLYHLLPGICEFLLLSLITLMVHFNLAESDNKYLLFFEEVYSYLTIIYAIVIQVLILKKIAAYNGRLFHYFSTVHYKYLNWLKWVCVIYIANELYYCIYYLFFLKIDSFDYYYLPFVLAELGLIYYIAIGALLQVNLKTDLPETATMEDEDGNEELAEIFEKIEHFMQSEKPYLNPDLNLKLFAQLIGLPERQISNAINKSAATNFYTFINLYRVEEAKQLLRSDAQKKFSIVGIGEAAGFNSKSSFYTNFKKATQITPTQFLKELSQNTFQDS